MKKKTKIKCVSILILVAVFCLISCTAGEDEAVLKAAEYTDEVAKAIIEAGWKIAGSILIGSIVIGSLSK